MLPTSAGVDGVSNWATEAGGRHLGYWNWMFSKILNLHVTPMPPIKFLLNLTYDIGRDVVWRFSRWLLWQNGTILGTLNLYAAPMPPIKFQHIFTVWEMLFEYFQVGHYGSHLGYKNGRILAILNLYVSPSTSHQVWTPADLGFGSRVVWRFSRWPLWPPAWIWKQTNFSNSESICQFNASHQVSAQFDLKSGGDVFWRFQDCCSGYLNGTI